MIREYLVERQHTPFNDEFEGVNVVRPSWAWLPKEMFWKNHVDFLHLFAGGTISKVIRDYRPDLILSSGAHPYGTYAKYVKRQFDIPYYSIMVGDDILIDPDINPGWTTVQDFLNAFCDLNICVSDQMLNDVQEKRRLRNLIALKYGYEKSLYYYSGEKKIDPARTRLVSIGYFERVKGHDILLKAMTLLPERFELTLRGDGILRGHYERFIEEHGLSNRVRIIGKVDKLKSLLDECDIFCMPSRSEGLPAAPLEAMACGLPVVAARVGGLKDIVTDGFNGFLCEPESAEDLAAKIQKAAVEVRNHEDIAEWVSKRYSWDNWARNLVKLFQERELRN